MRNVLSIEFRPGTSADRRFVAHLSGDVFARFGEYDRLLVALMGSPEVATVIAEAGGRPVGFAMVALDEIAPGEADLVAIAVTPSRQRKGIGRRLLEEVELAVRGSTRRGSPVIQLNVAEDNEAGRKLFESAGYSVVPGKRGQYPNGQPSIVMKKSLAAPARAGARPRVGSGRSPMARRATLSPGDPSGS